MADKYSSHKGGKSGGMKYGSKYGSHKTSTGSKMPKSYSKK